MLRTTSYQPETDTLPPIGLAKWRGATEPLRRTPATPGRSGPISLLLLCSFLLAAVAPKPTMGQVNTEAFRPSGSQDGISGSSSLTLVARRGNSESERAGLGLNLFKASPFTPEQVAKAKRPVPPDLLSARRLLMMIAEYDYEESRGDNTLNRGFAHLRWTAMTSPRFGWEAFSQLETDEFTRLDRRTLLGGGVRYGAYQRKRATMFVGIGAMGEWERIDQSTTGGSNLRLTRNLVRLSSYFNARWQHSNKREEMSTITYLQPALENFDDYRILSQGRVSTAITERLALNLLVNLRHDSEPPDDIDTSDVEIKTGFSFSF